MPTGLIWMVLCLQACKIVGGQRYTKRLNEKQITALLKVTCQRPRDRENDILKVICPLWVFPFGLPLKVFKTHLLEGGFHILIKNASFPSPTDVRPHNPHPSLGLAFSLTLVLSSNWCGISQFTPFWAQRPCWHTTLCPSTLGISVLAHHQCPPPSGLRQWTFLSHSFLTLYMIAR